VVASHVDHAIGLKERLKGLLGRKELPEGHGLWIDSCNSIHTFFMKFSIDAVFLSREGIVLKLHTNLKPFRFTGLVWGASSVLELPEGTIGKTKIQKGDQLRLVEK